MSLLDPALKSRRSITLDSLLSDMYLHTYHLSVLRTSHLLGRVGAAAWRARLWAAEGPIASVSSPLRRPVSTAAAELSGELVACAGQGQLSWMAWRSQMALLSCI